MEDRGGYEKLTPREAIERKQKEISESFTAKENELAVEGTLLTPERKDIISLPFLDLKQKLADGTLSAVEVLKAYQAKALIETKITNCVTDLIPDAEKWAEELDELPETQRGLLHGIPVSIKENYDVRGMDTTLGLSRELGKPAPKHCALVEVLLSQGAVPFVKTNLSQLTYSMGTSNPVFGATKNPHDTSRSPGGSSGGEGALIAGNGSMAGFGTDVGGSCRIPALFCGIYSLRWTQKRVSREGTYGPFRELVGNHEGTGVFGRSVEALAGIMEGLLTTDLMFKLDPTSPPVHWRPSLYNSTRKLKVGWFDTNDFYPTTPGIRRAIGEAKAAFEKRGHTTVRFDIPDLAFMYNLVFDFLMSEGGGGLLKRWEGGEIVDECLDVVKRLMAVPNWIKKLRHAYINTWSPKIAKLASQEVVHASGIWTKTFEKKDYEEKVIRAWKEADIDVLLQPGFPTPAIHPSQNGNLLTGIIYLIFYNFIDFPAGIVPVTKETEEDQSKLSDYPTHDFAFKCVKETTTDATGMPLGVQIGGLPYTEETILYAMKELQTALDEA